jgi:hypothetical protein
MENYDLITSEIRNQILKLNYDWFESKVFFFLTGSALAEAKDIHFNKDVDLAAYCWNNDIGSMISIEPTGYAIANSIVFIINNHIKRYSDVYAIQLIIQKVFEVIDEEAASLIRSGNTNYKTVLNFFVDNTKTLISQKFSHIKEQVALTKAFAAFDRKLTPEICAKIANFRINNQKLITSVPKGTSEGEALFYLLSSPVGEKSKITLRVDDWINNDVFYLFLKLSENVTDLNTPTEIEAKKALYLKKPTLFTSSAFRTFKSQKLPVYIDKSKHKSLIDTQLRTIF